MIAKKKNVKFEAEDKTQNPFMIPLQATKEEEKKTNEICHPPKPELDSQPLGFFAGKNGQESMEFDGTRCRGRLFATPQSSENSRPFSESP